jgi:phosphoribosylformylglycinamidine synthase
MRARISVKLKPDVLDVQGKTVERGVNDLGFTSVENVRVGKLIELDINSASAQEAHRIALELCEKLLVNPVIEIFEIEEIK